MKIRKLLDLLEAYIVDYPEIADAVILPVGAECWGETSGVAIDDEGCTPLAREKAA
jgi:hypothetical protein